MNIQRFAFVYLRLALGAAFLSAVVSRLGAWPASFEKFIQYTAEVNSFLPAAIAPFLAWAVTSLEIAIGILLMLGFWPRAVAFAAAVLLALFGTAMATSFGIKEALDYSVFSASAGALLLALHTAERKTA